VTTSSEELHRTLGELVATTRAIQEDIGEIKGEVIPNGRDRMRTVEATLSTVNRRVIAASAVVVCLAPAVSWIVIPPIRQALTGILM